jgi:hypothetical protein
MGEVNEWARYQWRKLPALHVPKWGYGDCTATIHTYTYRFHPPESALYERCISLSWCSDCRRWTGSMVYVARETDLPDPLAELDPEQRERLHRKEYALVRHLDRLVRRNTRP